MEHYDKVLVLSDSDMGVLHGVLHQNQLESALEFIQNDDYYPTLTDKLTHLVYSIADGHCFTDGNKRTSLILGAYFLELNGMGELVPRFLIEMENIVLWVAAKLLDKNQLHDIIDDLVSLGELSEQTQLSLVGMLEAYDDLIRSSGLNGPDVTKDSLG